MNPSVVPLSGFKTSLIISLILPEPGLYFEAITIMNVYPVKEQLKNDSTAPYKRQSGDDGNTLYYV